MEKIVIEVINPVVSKVHGREARKFLAPCVEFTKTWWKQGKFNKDPQEYQKSMLNRNSGIILTGLVPKLKLYAGMNDVKCEIAHNPDFAEHHAWLKNPIEPSIDGITFRKDQIPLIKAAIKRKRGVLQAVTGYGKTILMMGIISAFPKQKVLILCHSVSIVTQTQKELKKHGFKSDIYTSKNKKALNEQIVLSTIQTFSKVNPKLYGIFFDITIIDEVHHFSKSYENVMDVNLCPMRIGFTATMPKDDPERLLKIEGYMGRVLKKVSLNKAEELKIIAKPKIKLIPVPRWTSKLWKYADIYEGFIVENENRNKLIINQLEENLKNDFTTLVMVVNIAQGNNLLEIAEERNLDIVFLQGSSVTELREKVVESLEKKKVKSVIATNIFKEGVNIKSLNSMILAGGGKSEVKTLQIAGRALRRTDDKKEALIVDFLDRGKYLADHAMNRINYYIENNWEIIS